MSWQQFIENFQGKKLERPISCENPIGVCKNDNYAIKVYRCYWQNGWVDGAGLSINQPFEVLCTPTFGADVEYQAWVTSLVEENGRITYSYYVKLESCDDIIQKPNFPAI